MAAKIKKGDDVVVLTGKDKGRTGKVTRVLPKDNRVVVSDKGDKTVVVKVERTLLHPVMKKTVRLSKKYHAHDEANSLKVGDVARIRECAPKSKLKRWEVYSGDDAATSA